MKTLKKILRKKSALLGILMIVLNLSLFIIINPNISSIDLKSKEELKIIKSPIKISADHKPPTVSIENPNNGDTVSGTVFINATADDNVGVDRVEFYIDNVLEHTEYVSPYEFDWDTTTYSDEMHEIKAIAYDAWGNSETDTISVIVNNNDTISPTVSIENPNNGDTVSGTVFMTATADDNVGVDRVEFYIDNDLKRTDMTLPYSYDWDTTTYSDGIHVIKAIAYDAAGNNETDTISVTVDNSDTISPTVSIVNPSQGSTVNGTCTITVAASDNIGVIKVEFYIDNDLQYTDTSSSYQYEWDTTKFTNGTHEIKVIAFDAAGNMNLDTIDIYVINNGVVINTYPPSDFQMIAIILLILVGGFVTIGVVGSIKHSHHNKHPHKPVVLVKSKYSAKSKYPAKPVTQTRKMNLITIPPEPKKPTSAKTNRKKVYTRDQKVIVPLQRNQSIRSQQSRNQRSGNQRTRVRKETIPQSEAKQAILQKINVQQLKTQQKKLQQLNNEQPRTLQSKNLQKRIPQRNFQQNGNLNKDNLINKLKYMLQNDEDLQEKYKKKIKNILKKNNGNTNGNPNLRNYSQNQLNKMVEILIQNNKELLKKYKKKLVNN